MHSMPAAPGLLAGRPVRFAQASAVSGSGIDSVAGAGLHGGLDGGSPHFRPALFGDPAGLTLQQADECGLATAAELMFFYGAPLAHVVAYCEHLRLENINRRNMELSRRIARQRPSASRSIFSGWGS